jgi:hypothetical protein
MRHLPAEAAEARRAAAPARPPLLSKKAGERLRSGLLAPGSSYSPRLPGADRASGSCGFRPRSQRRARGGISPPSLRKIGSRALAEPGDSRNDRAGPALGPETVLIRRHLKPAPVRPARRPGEGVAERTLPSVDQPPETQSPAAVPEGFPRCPGSSEDLRWAADPTGAVPHAPGRGGPGRSLFRPDPHGVHPRPFQAPR